MSAPHESPALAVARAHVEAWTNHDYDAARRGLAPDVHVTAITTMPSPPPTDLTGADDYMTGLIQFARAVVPGSARIIAGTGDDRNALIMLTVEADFGAGKVTPGRMIAGTASAPKGANEGRQRPAHTQPRRGERRAPRNLRRRGRFQPWRENIPLNTIQGAAASGASGSWPPDRGRDHHEIAEDHRTADELAEVMRHYLW